MEKVNASRSPGRIPLLICVGLLSVCSLHGEAVIRIDASKVKGPVNPLIFGQNIEAADGQFIFSPVPAPKPTGDGIWDPAGKQPVPELVEESKRLGVTMWRYPGGCLAHTFDWKKTVGPVESRPDFVFGLEEFLTLCKETVAEPIITVSDYAATPDEAAALVEFLNAPAEPRFPWAMKRAALGRPEPWKVKYFELGNESDHGNHDVVPKKVWSAPEYVAWFNEAAQKMRAVDPAIKLGALTGTNTGPYDPWNRTVAAGVKETADFIVIHTYAVALWSPDKPSTANPDLVMRSAMAGVAEFEDELSEYRRLLREASGRDFPLAITEYNASMVQPATDPIPFRLTWGTALFCADYLRLLLQPEQNILMAHYWQMLNGYWGFLEGPINVEGLPTEQRKWVKRPAYEIFRLWAAHLGKTVLDVSVDAPGVAFEGFGRSKARGEKRTVADEAPEVGIAAEAGLPGVSWRGDGNRLVLERFAEESYLEFGGFSVTGGGTYRLTFQARFAGKPATLKLGVGLMDKRGWEATQSAIGIQGVETAGEWQTFTGEITVLQDATELVLVWRLLNAGGTPAYGVAEIRNVRVEAAAPKPAYPAVTATVTLSGDGKTLHLMVFNKHHNATVPARFELSGFSVESGKIWILSAPSLETTTVGEGGVVESVHPLDGLSDQGFSQTLPPRSMSAVDIHLR